MLPQIDPDTLQATLTLDRKILTERDLVNWQKSLTFEWIQEYLNELIEGSKQLGDDKGTGQVNQQLVQFLDQVSELCNQHEQGSSHTSSNHKHQDFVEFRSKLSKLIASLHSSLPLLPNAALPELKFHLTRSFGSISRLDYGTSHELSFLLYLLILRLTSSLSASDSIPTLKLLKQYWEVSEHVRKTFGLEEAGKRGVWKKDEEGGGRMWFDSGASQARGHPSRSSSSHSLPTLQSTHSSPLYLLRSLLSAPNSSPSQSRSPTPSNLLPLYTSQVLFSLPALLHLRFGPYLPFSSEQGALESSADGLSKEEEAELEGMQDERVGGEGTVAPWNVPKLSGEEDHKELKGGSRGGSPKKGEKVSEGVSEVKSSTVGGDDEDSRKARIRMVEQLAGLEITE